MLLLEVWGSASAFKFKNLTIFGPFFRLFCYQVSNYGQTVGDTNKTHCSNLTEKFFTIFLSTTINQDPSGSIGNTQSSPTMVYSKGFARRNLFDFFSLQTQHPGNPNAPIGTANWYDRDTPGTTTTIHHTTTNRFFFFTGTTTCREPQCTNWHCQLARPGHPWHNNNSSYNN